MRHAAPRQPKKSGGFSWGRVALPDGGVSYRLFRRDQRGALHYFMRNYSAADLERGLNMRLVIADELKYARRALRDQVDEIDLALMGVTQ